MKNIRWVLFLSGLVLFMATCNKDEDSPDIIEFQPEPTPIGTETGDPSFGLVGPEGGSLSSSDGKLELSFPVGALSSVTEISIQAVTNNAPGGIGKAYRFGPDGTQLKTPATLIFHYTDDDVAGSLPMFLGMAVQDADQIWYYLGLPVLDTVNKTISITSKKLFADSQESAKKVKSTRASNFLDHATFLDLFIIPESAEVKKSESKQFQVYAIQNHTNIDDSHDGEDFLPPLPIRHEVSHIVKQWSVNGIRNGNSEYGTVSPNGASCTYTAPSSVPSRNPVDLTADIKLWYKDPVTGRDFNNLKITAPITVIDTKYEYQLKISLNWESWGAFAFGWNLTDLATADVTVINGIVSITNIKNNDGNVSPTSQTRVVIQGVSTCTGNVEEGSGSQGILNITRGSGQVIFNDLDPNSPWLNITVTNNGGMWPRIKYVCTNETPGYQGGTPYPTTEYFSRFVLTNEIQNNKSSPITITLTPKSLLPE